MKKIIRKVLWSLPLKNIIVFESIPEYACNTYPVFLKLKEMFPDYRMVWYVPEKQPKKNGADAVFSYRDVDMLSKFQRWYYTHFAKAFISCNRIYEKKRPEQVSIFLCHGSKTKRTRGRYEVGAGVDYVDVQSHFFDEIITYEYNCPASKLVYLGYPRCDWLFEEPETVQRKVRALELNAEHYVIWLPTFRKHKRAEREEQMDMEKYASMGMPLVYSPEDLRRLNSFLASIDTCILYKPHPAQDIGSLKAETLSHIRVINDRDLSDRGLQLYEVLAGSDGLITDYSSVYFDYLLLNRPIATTTDDIDQWKQMTGFAFDLDGFYDRSTVRCPNLDALLAFLNDVHNGKDSLAAGREEIRALTNIWNDGESARRVAEFIKEKIGE